MNVDPRRTFPAFYTNRAIGALSCATRWTVSGIIGDLDDDNATHKAPIDMRHLLDHGRLRGAFQSDDVCCVDLPELTDRLPDAANCAFALQASTDGYLVIDIEPDCPQEISLELLRLPGIRYAETSMSGKGFHLLMTLPSNFHDHPVAAGKRVLREEHGWYELLLDHWVTFTRNPIKQDVVHQLNTMTTPSQYTSLDELYTELAEKARADNSTSGTGIDTGVDTPTIPGADDIVSDTISSAITHLKTPEDFDFDMSRYEFSVLASLYGFLRTQVNRRIVYGMDYSESDLVWLLYLCAREILEHRPKHDELRHGRPYLVDRAASLVADRLEEQRQLAAGR